MRPAKTASAEGSASGGVSRRRTFRGTPREVHGDTVKTKLKSAVVATCEGCNETGHEFAQCPHRSDSVMEDFEEDDDEAESSDY